MINLNPFFKPMCMRFQNDGDGDGGGGGGGTAVMIDENGNFTEDFYNTFDENDRPTITRYKNPKELGKGHINLRRTIDKPVDRLLVLPDENSSDEEIAAFNQRIGVPEDPVGYEFELNPEIKNIDIDENKLNAFREIAKKYGIPKSKFAGLVNDYLALIDKEAGDFELIRANDKANEIDEDNKIADDYFGESKDERIARADMLLRKYGNIEIKNEKGEVVANAVEKLIEKYPSLKHSPWLTMIIDKIAEDMSEDRLKGITGVTAPTNAAIRNKIAKIRANPAYTDVSHPDNKRLNQEVLKLYTQLKA